MTSQIDITKPIFGTPTTQSVRDNFTTAANEISDLQSRTTGSPFLPIAGGRMGGVMYLFNDPTDAMMPATKGYVDAASGSGGGGIPEAPADNVHYGRYNGAWASVLGLPGGSLTGPLILAADPTNALGAVTKQYADAIAASHLIDAPNDANTYGRRAAAWVGVLPIVGGQLTGSLGVGVPLPATLSTTDRAVLAAQVSASKILLINAYLDTAGALRYRAAGPAVAYSIDPTTGQGAAISSAISGAADAAASFQYPVYIDPKGNVRLPGAPAIPTNAAISVASAVGYVATGHYAWNVYLPTPGTNWTYLQNGYAGMLYLDTAGPIYLSLWPSGSAGGNTPAARTWAFNQDGSMNCPNLVTVAGAGLQARATTGSGGFIGSHDANNSSNCGFWTSNGTIYFGSAGGNNVATGSRAYMDSAGTLVVNGGLYAANTTAFGIYPNVGGDSIYGASAGFAMVWVVASGSWQFLQGSFGNYWNMRNDNLCYNQLGGVAGYGGYTNLSDRRAKANITSSAYGLAELARLTVVEFDRMPKLPKREPEPDEPPFPAPVTYHEIGFIAQDVRAVIPEAVRVVGIELPDGKGTLDDPEPSLGLTYETILAVAVKAIQEIDARLIAKGI